MKTLLKLLILLASNYLGCQQLYQVQNKGSASFTGYTIRNLLISDNGAWLTVKQQYPKDIDTLLVFQRNKPENPVIKFGGMTDKQFFVCNDKLLTAGKGNAILIDLTSLKQKEFPKIKMLDYLPALHCFYLLDQESTLAVYDNSGSQLSNISHVKGNILTDRNKSRLFVMTANNEVYDLSSKFPKIIYKGTSELDRIELSSSGKMLMVTQRDKESLKPIFIDTRTGVIKTLSKDYQKVESIESIEIKNGSSYLIQFKRRTLINQTPQIWYGNEGNLQNYEDEFVNRFTYIVWQSNDGKIIELSEDDSDLMFTTFNNDRYLLAFDPVKCHNYETEQRLVDVSFYDLINSNYKKILTDISHLVYSTDGRYIIGLMEKDKKNKKWILIDVYSLKKTLIPNNQLKKPVFTIDNRSIYFEGNDDIWRYSIKKHSLVPIGLSNGQATIENAKKIANRGAYSIFNIPIEATT